MDSVPGMKCSCVSDGTALNAGGDAQCEIEIGPPPVEDLEDMKIKIHMDTTVRPCAEPAMAALGGGITLPQLSGTADTALDTAVSAAIQDLAADVKPDVEYDENNNQITVSMSVEAGKTEEVELPIMKWGVADFFIKLNLHVEGNAAALKTILAVDLCMKTPKATLLGKGIPSIEICGEHIPKCGAEDYPLPKAWDLLDDLVYTAQATICKATPDTNWHQMFGSPPIEMTPSQEISFTEACIQAASDSSSSGSSSSDAAPGAVAGAYFGGLFTSAILACAIVAFLVKKGKMANPLERFKRKPETSAPEQEMPEQANTQKDSYHSAAEAIAPAGELAGALAGAPFAAAFTAVAQPAAAVAAAIATAADSAAPVAVQKRRKSKKPKFSEGTTGHPTPPAEDDPSTPTQSV